MSSAPRRARGLRHSWKPFGLGETKPRHFREMLRVAWENRDNLRYAWRVLTRGVCDGCALGTSGLKDWTIDGTHLCMVRLELLRLNTMPAMDPALLADAERLRGMSSRELRELGRLPYPMRRRAGEPGFTRVSWEELWNEAGARWARAEPRRTAMYLTSRGITNEVYYVAQKVMRYLGSPHVDNSARLCHSPSTAGLKSTVGVAATTCSYRDWYEADLIVFLGSNPANDQPVATKYLLEARKRGARTVQVNAFREPGMRRYWVPSSASSALFGSNLCDRDFLVRVGGDLAFLHAVARRLVARGDWKRDFVEQACAGFEEYRAFLDGLDPEALCRIAGVDAEEVEAFADELAAADKAVFVWSMGITQHAQGADTVAAIAHLALLGEHVGRPGTGLMPIRGHSGVQGGAEMGAYANALPGGVPVDPEHAARFSGQWGFPVPDAPGWTTVEQLEAARRGELEALYCIGGNFLETMPDPPAVEEALGAIPLRMHADIVVTSQMLVEPRETVYLLPSRTRYEQRDGGTETTTERRVIYSPHIPGHDVGEARSEWEMLLELARAAKPDGCDSVHFENGRAIREDIARAVPFYAGIEKLEKQGDQFQWGGPRLCTGREFPTADGRARFHPAAPRELAGGAVAGEATGTAAGAAAGTAAGAAAEGGEAPSAPRFRVATRRGKQFNSMVQRDRDPLTGAERDHVFMCAEDAGRLGLTGDDPVVLRNALGEFRGRVFVAEVAPGTLQGHWPELNVLIPGGVTDPGGGVPDYNAEVTVERG